MTGRRWLKITFDPLLPGDALVSNYPRKRLKRVGGQWVVFDKDRGEYSAQTRVFASGHIQACHAWIDAERAQDAPLRLGLT